MLFAEKQPFRLVDRSFNELKLFGHYPNMVYIEIIPRDDNYVVLEDICSKQLHSVNRHVIRNLLLHEICVHSESLIQRQLAEYDLKFQIGLDLFPLKLTQIVPASVILVISHKKQQNKNFCLNCSVLLEL